jgi:transcriptional regulator GlxA family with amidase domain
LRERQRGTSWPIRRSWPDDPLIQRFERWARGRLAEGFSLDHAAEAVGTSKRTLARRMQSVLGKSPRAFFQDLRIERAVHLLSGAAVGYAEGVTLRALLGSGLTYGARGQHMSGNE